MIKGRKERGAEKERGWKERVSGNLSPAIGNLMPTKPIKSVKIGLGHF